MKITFLLLKDNHKIFMSEKYHSSVPCLSSLLLKTRTNFSLFNENLLVLPENRIHLLVGVAPKDTTTLKTGRKDLLLTAGKESAGDLPLSSYLPSSKTKAVLS